MLKNNLILIYIRIELENKEIKKKELRYSHGKQQKKIDKKIIKLLKRILSKVIELHT